MLLVLFGCFCFYNKARLSSVGPFVFFNHLYLNLVLLDDINNNNRLISVLVINL